MMNLEVRTIMSTRPEVVTPQMSVEEVSHVMLDKRLQQMPVVEDGKLIGLITTHDLWKRYENNQSIGHMRVREVMNTNILKISPKDKVGTAAELFADKRFKTLPVVNLRNELKGVITAFDIIKMQFREEYKEPILYREAFAV